ncbi:hypothetical protein D9M71_291240 [compost metagenome]
MGFTGHRIERIAPPLTVLLRNLGTGFAVADTRHFLHAEKRLAVDHPAFVHQREIQTRQGRGNGLVALFDLPIGEQRLIGRTALRIGRKQHQARSVPVDAMQGHQMRIIQTPDQATQQCVFDVLAGGRHRKEMRFVRHHQVFIHVQDVFLHGDGLFIRHFAKIMNAQTLLVGKLYADRRPLGIQNTATGNAVQPLLATDRLEVLAKAIEHGCPRAGRQANGTGLVPGRIERRAGHGDTLEAGNAAIITHQRRSAQHGSPGLTPLR